MHRSGFPLVPPSRALLGALFGLLLTGGGLLVAASAANPPEPAPGADRQEPPSAQAIEFFEKKVRPIFATACASCHGATGNAAGGLRLDSRENLLRGGSRGPAVVPGQPEASLLLRAVSYQDTHLQMPPRGRLPADAVANLTEWVRMGAPWPPTVRRQPAGGSRATASPASARAAAHWAFRPIRVPRVPTVRNRGWVRTPIDAFVLAKLEARGLSPAPPADRRTLIRRVTFDLIGLPPTPEEVEAFVRDPSPDAYRKVVDRLLASPHYGERWARHWLDLVRYAETDGHEYDLEKPNAWRYRDYVIRALNADVPYSRFVMEHVAGDLLPNPRRHPQEGFDESIIGTGFWWLGEGKHSPVDLLQDEAERIDNQIDVFGKTFLGLTLGCARCHDHKFDPIPTQDYYGLFAFLRSSRYQQAAIDAPEKIRASARAVEALDAELLPGLARLWLAARAAGLERLGALLTGSGLASVPSSPNGGAAAIRAGSVRLAGTEAPSPDPGGGARWDRYLRETAAKDPADPFHPWALLRERPPTEFEQSRKELLAALEARRADGTTLFETFEKDGFPGWQRSGEAFGDGPIAAPRLRLDASGDLRASGVALPGTADSGRLSGRLQGALRSRTFTLSAPRIFYRMAGRGGRINLIIDGFQRIRDPVYGKLTIPVQADGFRWYAQDVSLWVGHRAYVEILDDGPGWIAVDEIRFGERPPQNAPNPLVRRLLADPALDTPERLARGYRDLLFETARRWAEGRPENEPERRARAELLDWMVRNAALLPAAEPPAPAPELAELIERRRSLEAAIPEPARAMAMADGTTEATYVYVRGNHRNPGEIAPRRFLRILPGGDRPVVAEGSGRLELARRLVSPANPLLPRVIVNRVWQHHFGEGIVRTPDDFGTRGEPPTHPELLDWLACYFTGRVDASGRPTGTVADPYAAVPGGPWSLKRLHRLIVLSSVYRMSGRRDRRAEAVDPQNRLLHRIPPRRLEAEAIRDAILAVSGRLDRTMYGPGILPYLTPFLEGRGRPDRSGPLDGAGRRSIYLAVRRNFLTPMFLAFDYPVPFTTIGKRSVSTVPAQALVLMNNPFVVEQTRFWARRLLAEPAADPATRVRRMYLAAFARPPSDAELTEAIRFVEEQRQRYAEEVELRAWADLAHVLVNLKEFIFVN